MIKRLLCAVLLTCAYAYGQQINPGTQINWPLATGCTTSGFVYSPESNTCVATGGGGGLPTATLPGEAPVSTGPGTTYTAQQVIVGVSLANYNASNLPVTYGNVTSSSNTVTVADASSWVNGEGIFIPAVSANGAYPVNGVVCDNVTVSGSTITMLNSDGSACNAGWTSGSNSVPVFHFDMTHGAITSGTNSLTVTSATTFSTGQGILVAGAGSAGADLICPVIGVSGTTVTLFQSDGSTACNAGTTVSTAQVFHDDTYALSQALAGGNYVRVPAGTYFLSSETDLTNAGTLYGDGLYQSAFISMENGIKTLVAKSSGITVKDLGIYQPDSFTPTSGDLLDDCSTAATNICFNNNFTGLMLYRGWNAFAVYGKTIQGTFSYSTIHSPINAGLYLDNPVPYGDINFNNLQINNCNGGCTTGTYGLLVDAADANSFNSVKFNSFVHNIWVTANAGQVDHLRFNNVSFEDFTNSTGSAIQKLSTNSVFGIQFNGGEAEDKLTIGNGVTGTQVNGVRFYSGVSGTTSSLDIAGQNTSVTGGSMQNCTGDCVRLETTASGATISGVTMTTATGYGINNLAGLNSTNSYMGNQMTGMASGNYGATIDGPGERFPAQVDYPMWRLVDTNTTANNNGPIISAYRPTLSASGYVQWLFGEGAAYGNGASAGFWYVGSANNCNSEFFGINGGTNPFQIAYDNRVGIGVALGTCPAQALEVNGISQFDNQINLIQPAATANPQFGEFLAPNTTSGTGHYAYEQFGVVATTNNAFNLQFDYIGAGSSSNFGAWAMDGSTNNNIDIFGNGSTVFGATTPSAGPANGIAVGTAENAQIDGSGNISIAAVAAATSGANVNSPNVNWIGHVWNGTSSVTSTWNCFNDLSQWTGSPTNAASILNCSQSGSSGTSVFKVPQLSAATINSANIIGFAAAGATSLAASVTTAATSSNNYSSPKFIIDGALWTGSANASDTYLLQDVIPSTGTEPATVLTLTHTGGMGGASVDFSAVASFKAAIGNFTGHIATPTVDNTSASENLGTTAAVTAYGDSIMYGYWADPGGPPFPDGFIYKVCANKDWTCTNDAVSGAEMMDANMAQAILNDSVVQSDVSTVLIGSNDMRSTNCTGCSVGMSTVAAQAQWESGFAAELAWLSIPAGPNKTTGQACPSTGPINCTYTGSGWSNGSIWGGSIVKQDTTAGDTLTINFSGSTFYFFGFAQYTNTSTYSLTIDGVALPTSTGGAFNDTGTITRTFNDAAIAYSPGLIRFSGLANTAHVLVLTVTSIDSGFGISFTGFAVPDGSIQRTGPYVYVGTTPRAQDSGYTSDGGSDAIVAQFDQMERDTVNELASDGLHIQLVDDTSVLNPDAGTDLYYTDGFHPNGPGHAAIAQAWEDALTSVLLPEDRAQAQVFKSLNPCTQGQSFGVGGCAAGASRGDLSAAESATTGKLFLGLDGGGLYRTGANMFQLNNSSGATGLTVSTLSATENVTTPIVTGSDTATVTVIDGTGSNTATCTGCTASSGFITYSVGATIPVSPAGGILQLNFTALASDIHCVIGANNVAAAGVQPFESATGTSNFQIGTASGTYTPSTDYGFTYVCSN